MSKIEVISNLPKFTETLEKADRKNRLKTQRRAGAAVVLLTGAAYLIGTAFDRSVGQIEPPGIPKAFASEQVFQQMSKQEAMRAQENYKKTLVWMLQNPNLSIRSIPQKIASNAQYVYTLDTGKYAEAGVVVEYLQGAKKMAILVSLSKFSSDMKTSDLFLAAEDLGSSGNILAIPGIDPNRFVTDSIYRDELNQKAKVSLR